MMRMNFSELILSYYSKWVKKIPHKCKYFQTEVIRVKNIFTPVTECVQSLRHKPILHTEIPIKHH